MLRFNSELYRQRRSSQRTAMFCPLPDVKGLIVTLRTSDGVTRGNVTLNGMVIGLVRGAAPSEEKLREMLRRSGSE